jgi:hypothetical protein
VKSTLHGFGVELIVRFAAIPCLGAVVVLLVASTADVLVMTQFHVTLASC